MDPEEKENVSKSVKELYAMEVIVKSKFLIWKFSNSKFNVTMWFKYL